MEGKEYQNAQNVEKLSELTSVIIVLAILGYIIRAITIIPEIAAYSSFGNDTNDLYHNLFYNIIFAISLILICRKKYYGVIVFFVFQLINGIMNTLHSNYDLSYSIGRYLITSVVSCAIFAGILFIKCNGKSGWDVIFKRAKHPK